MIRSDVGTVENTSIHESCDVTVNGVEERGIIVDFSEPDTDPTVSTKVEFEDGSVLNADNAAPVTIDVD